MYLGVLVQDWLAFTQGGVHLTFEGKLRVKNGGAPLEKDNFAFCKVMLFHIKSIQQKEEHNFLVA